MRPGRLGVEDPRDLGVAGAPEGVQARARDRHVRVATVGEAGIVGRVERGLLHVGQERHEAAHRLVGAPRGQVLGEGRHRIATVGALVIGQPQAELLEVVGALGTPRGLARRLHGREQQGDQHGDDRDHHQKLDQGEASSSHPVISRLVQAGEWRARRRTLPRRKPTGGISGTNTGARPGVVGCGRFAESLANDRNPAPVRASSAVVLRDGPGSGGIGRGSRAVGMAGGSHLRAEDVFAFPGGTLGATLSLRAPTEIEPTAGCVESWPSQPLATASTTKRNPVHNLL